MIESDRSFTEERKGRKGMPFSDAEISMNKAERDAGWADVRFSRRNASVAELSLLY